MDISKLPRLSRTDAPPPPDPAALDPAPAGPGAFEVIPSTSATTPGYCACGAPLRAGSNFCDSCGARVSSGGPARALQYRPNIDIGTGAEVWISVAVGVLLILMSPRIWQYFLMPGSFTWTFNGADGNPLPYVKTFFFWGDLALAAFAVSLVLEGVVIAARRRPRLVMAVLVVTVLTTLLNLGYVVFMLGKGYGFQMMSGLAVAFGVYIAIFQWKLLQASRSEPFARA